MTGSKSLGDTGFLQFLGSFQVIMANPVNGSRVFCAGEIHFYLDIQCLAAENRQVPALPAITQAQQARLWKLSWDLKTHAP